jgi:hypothetical protein
MLTNPSLRPIMAAFIAGIFLLSACGPTQDQTQPGQVPAEPPGTPATAGPTPTPDLGAPVKTEAGKVTLTLDAKAYPMGQKIRVTVANGLDRTIYSDDMKTSCTILIVEQESAGKWSPVPGCPMERMPFSVAIGPGMGRTIEIDPGASLFDGVQPGQSGLPAGNYRIRFTFRFAPEEGAAETESSLSDTFSVQS